MIGQRHFITDFVQEDCLTNYKNYYVYAEMVRSRNVTHEFAVYVPEITVGNISDHITGIYAILKDGIETDFVRDCKITVMWEGDVKCKLTIIDYWISLFMWEMILKTGQPVRPKHIFLGTPVENEEFPWELKRKDIRDYIDKHVLTIENKIRVGNQKLNQIIADSICRTSYFETFAMFLANTINNEDDIALMNASSEFDALYHCSLAGVPFDQVKERGMDITYQAIDIIKNSKKLLGFEHGLANSFRANEAINPRQFKEASFNIGTKPNGSGGIYPYIIDKSFKTGGVNDPLSYFIESSTARAAQNMSKINVGESGDFARLLGLNNMDTVLNMNSQFECQSPHFIQFEVKSKKHLSMVKNRYFRYKPNGLDYHINHLTDTDLIGQTIYLHSPMTCSSNSSGHGICRRCYGDLYWTNLNINIGKIAAEILSAQLTQILLSAKHLLETIIEKIVWNKEFEDFFDIDINSIKISDDILDDNNLKKYFLVIDPESVQLVNEEDDVVSSDDDDSESPMEEEVISYSEYITSFVVITPDKREITFASQDQHELYISQELNNIIRKKAYASEGKVVIPFTDIGDSILFYIKINNNEISKTMNDIINIINKSAVTENLTKDSAMQSIVDLVINGHLDIDAVHLEVILANQIVDPANILKRPNWNNPTAMYRMFTLNQALTNNPSVIISLLYKDLNRVLYNPLTYTKHAPSFFDLFFHTQPQVYMDQEILTDDTSHIRDYEETIPMVEIVGESREEEFLKKIEETM